MKRRLLPLLLPLLALAAPPAAAQLPVDCAALLAALTAERQPDVLIEASATARELRFEAQPAVRVLANGCALPDSVGVVERRNLPQPVQPGVTYRDVGVSIRVPVSLRVECLLPALLRAASADSAAGGATPLAGLCGSGGARPASPEGG